MRPVTAMLPGHELEIAKTKRRERVPNHRLPFMRKEVNVSMAIPRTIDEFLVEVTREAVWETVSAQDALRRCLDRSTATNHAYLAVWDTVRRAGLLATFDFQTAMIHASQTMLDPCRPSSRASAVRPARLMCSRPAATISPVVADVTPGSAELGPARIADTKPASDDTWVASALSFPPPLGIVASGYGSDPDEEL